MPVAYIPPQLNVRTCDYCGTRSHVRKDLKNPVELKRQLQERDWTYQDFLVLCPSCAKQKAKKDAMPADAKPSKLNSVPILGRFLS